MATKQTQAVKIRLLVAVPVDLTSLDSLTEVAKATENIRKAIAAAGGEVVELTTRTGQHAFAPIAAPASEDE